MENIILVASKTKTFAFKSEKALFRWMKSRGHTFGTDEKSGHQDRYTMLDKDGNETASVDHGGALYSAKDALDLMPEAE